MHPQGGEQPAEESRGAGEEGRGQSEGLPWDDSYST